jgi:hypothetical protein
MSTPSPNPSGNPHAKWLRMAAEEIAKAGHNGWGNTCDQAAAEVDRLEALVRSLDSQLLAARFPGIDRPTPEPRAVLDPPVIQAVYTRAGKALVCGRPGTYNDLPDDDERHHNCDAMGCSSIEHVLWRGPLTVDEPSVETGEGRESPDSVSVDAAANLIEGIAERHPRALNEQERGHLMDAAWLLRETGARLMEAERNCDTFLGALSPTTSGDLTLIDDLEAALDQQIYDQQKAHDFDAPDDAEFCVNITAKLWRRIGAEAGRRAKRQQ